ncbi:zona pellucida sperm-binding protein 4-like [Rhinoderma darwinii]|uniref:zona pellucida sperm-binding protein 4-like n=1 Tax=Rhinoderma darwinii TaxID=43563 RepID=UPI003F66A537
MGGSRAGLRVVLVFWTWCLLWCEAKGLWEGSSHLHCGVESMKLSVPMSIEDVAFSLMVLDFQGEPHILDDNSACGFWINQKLNGTMHISAAYDGCYITEEDREYVLTLVLEEIVNGQVEQYKVEKRCPVLTAMDAPSPSVCSAVSQDDKLSCMAKPVSREVCEEVGCCFSPSDFTIPCYYGNKLTTRCTSDNQMVVAISQDLTRPSLDLSSVHVVGLDSSCAGLTMSRSTSFAVFQFPLSCGRSTPVPGGAIVYENNIEAVRNAISWKGSTITRDSTMRVTVRCSYSQTDLVPVQLSVSTLAPPLPVTTSGPLLLEMRIAQDLAYSSYFSENDYPVVKVLRDPVYLEVRLLHRTDPKLVLVLNDCWATNSADPTLLPQWPILLDRCPFDGDNYISQTVPVGGPTQSLPYPTHYQRFVVKTFTFVDQSTQIALAGLIYFHCSASVCVPSAMDNCMTSCAPRKRRMVEDVELEPLKNVVTSDGPVEFLPVWRGALKLEGPLHSEYSTLDVVRAISAGGVGALLFVVFLGVWFRCRTKSKKHELNA